MFTVLAVSQKEDRKHSALQIHFQKENCYFNEASALSTQPDVVSVNYTWPTDGRDQHNKYYIISRIEEEIQAVYKLFRDKESCTPMVYKIRTMSYVTNGWPTKIVYTLIFSGTNRSNLFWKITSKRSLAIQLRIIANLFPETNFLSHSAFARAHTQRFLYRRCCGRDRTRIALSLSRRAYCIDFFSKQKQ